MTDREFDNLMKEALCSDSVPQQLNNSLMLALEKKRQKRAKVIKFVKACSSCAAVFICAVAVISYYNSNISHRTENHTPEVKNTIIEKKADIKEEEAQPKTNEEVQKIDVLPSVAPNKNRSANKNTVKEKTATPALEAAEEVNEPSVAQEEAIAPDMLQEKDAVSPDTMQQESAPLMMRRSMPSALCDLFNEGYDYISAISENIRTQIAIMDFPEKINFSQITGDESFSLNEENKLTIEFPAGTIASEEHGDLFFTVGTVQNGILE